MASGAIVPCGARCASPRSRAGEAVGTDRLAGAANGSVEEKSIRTGSAIASRAVTSGTAGADSCRRALDASSVDRCTHATDHTIHVVSGIAGGACRRKVTHITGITCLTRKPSLAQKTSAGYCAVLAVGADACRTR